MLVLVTGGTGVIGHGLIPALQRRGHRVRLLTRHAGTDVREWEGIEPWAGDVRDPLSLSDAAADVHAIVHVTGILNESPPEATFQSVNVDGVRHMLEEAARAGAPRFVFISSLGAERGASGYHRSKREAERRVRAYPGPWVVLRPGNVYGPDDPVVSRLLQMVRALPVVPVVGGDRRFQPIWYEDLGEAIAEVVERSDLDSRTLELAGPDAITVDELLERLEGVTSRNPRHLAVSKRVAAVGAKVAEKLSLEGSFARVTGLELPLDTSRLTMLAEENVIAPGGLNALTDVLGVTPTPLQEGLRRLALALPEQLPEKGVGALEQKSFWAVIERSDLDAPGLMRIFRAEIRELLPLEFVDGVGAIPRNAGRLVDVGDTLTLRLPARGEIQVRVEEAAERRLTLATVEGHPLAGIVRFSSEAEGPAVRFQIDVFTRAANLMDLVAMKVGGQAMQRGAWERAVENVVQRSGGGAPAGVRHRKHKLEEQAAEAVEGWIDELVQARKRGAVSARARKRGAGRS
jgi:NADH dehydrogenase